MSLQEILELFKGHIGIAKQAKLGAESQGLCYEGVPGTARNGYPRGGAQKGPGRGTRGNRGGRGSRGRGGGAGRPVRFYEKIKNLCYHYNNTTCTKQNCEATHKCSARNDQNEPCMADHPKKEHQ